MQCVVFLVAVVLVIARRPDLFTHPHFYAEDGARWYAEAYNLGWLRALAIPAGGYLNTLQRLVAAFALLVPLRYAPLLMNACGAAIQALPVCFLLSRRCAHWWPLKVRVWQAAIYLAIPNSREVHVVLTNAPFHLALLAFLVPVAAPPPNWRWKAFDIGVLVLSGLSGPFCIAILFLVLAFWRVRGERWSLMVAAILGPLALLQGVELLFGGLAERRLTPLGDTPMLFFKILTGNVYLGSLWGGNSFALHAPPPLVWLVMVVGTSVLFYAFWRGCIELRLFVVFAMVLLAAALSQPLIGGASAWQSLARDQSARYWFFPMLAVLWSMLFCATQRENKFVRIAGIVMLLGLSHGLQRDGRYPPASDQEFRFFVIKFNAAPAGTLVKVSDCPTGCTATLQKK